MPGDRLHAAVEPLKAVIFDLDGALADVERDGQRVGVQRPRLRHWPGHQ